MPKRGGGGGSSDQEDAGTTDWVKRLDPKDSRVEIQIGQSHIDPKLAKILQDKVQEMYTIVKAPYEAQNKTEWMFQQLVDMASTSLKFESHMMFFVGDSFHRTFPKPPSDVPGEMEVQWTDFTVSSGILNSIRALNIRGRPMDVF